MPDGRIAYVDFGNVAELSQTNKQTLIDAIVHAVNEDYEGMADDFIKLVRSCCLLTALWCFGAFPLAGFFGVTGSFDLRAGQTHKLG